MGGQLQLEEQGWKHASARASCFQCLQLLKLSMTATVDSGMQLPVAVVQAAAGQSTDLTG